MSGDNVNETGETVADAAAGAADSAASAPVAATAPATSDLDLSPRQVVPTAARGKKKPWFAYAVLAVVLTAGGFFVFQFLTNSLNYYCNVDEIGVKSNCDVGRSLRIQGVVDKDSISKAGTVTNFVITFHGQSMPVVLSSEPTGLFQECIAVVVRGKVIEDTDGSRTFEGNDIEVKHDATYEKDNKDRIDEAQKESDACSRKA